MTFLSKFPFFDSVENALSDLTSAATRLEALATKHREKTAYHNRERILNSAAADRAERVANKLKALTD